MSARLRGLAAGVLASALPSLLVAQGTGNPTEVPRNLRPPTGMCRIWVDGVPASRQPAPTDCATAVRNRPPNGRVIFPDSPARGASEQPPKASKNDPSPPRADTGSAKRRKPPSR